MSKFKKNTDKGQIVRIVLALNALFWVALAIVIVINAVPFTDRKPNFEEELPGFKFGHWAVPVEMESRSILFRTVYTAYLPSYRMATGLTEWMTSPRTSDERIGPFSIGAYILFGTMLTSFLQWYILAVLLWRSSVWIRKLTAKFSDTSNR